MGMAGLKGERWGTLSRSLVERRAEGKGSGRVGRRRGGHRHIDVRLRLRLEFLRLPVGSRLVTPRLGRVRLLVLWLLHLRWLVLWWLWL